MPASKRTTPCTCTCHPSTPLTGANLTPLGQRNLHPHRPRKHLDGNSSSKSTSRPPGVKVPHSPIGLFDERFDREVGNVAFATRGEVLGPRAYDDFPQEEGMMDLPLCQEAECLPVRSASPALTAMSWEKTELAPEGRKASPALSAMEWCAEEGRTCGLIELKAEAEGVKVSPALSAMEWQAEKTKRVDHGGYGGGVERVGHGLMKRAEEDERVSRGRGVVGEGSEYSSSRDGEGDDDECVWSGEDIM